MIVEAKVSIQASRAAIWAVLTDFERAAEIIRGIDKIEVVEKPAQGLVGLRWRETRMLFGKPATAEKWITEAAENEFYTTRAESDGFVFLSTTCLTESDGVVKLNSSHVSEPQSRLAKFQAIVMGLFFKGVARKAILQDLNDIKSMVEKK